MTASGPATLTVPTHPRVPVPSSARAVLTVDLNALRAKVGESSGLNATLKFDCGADGVIVIDGVSMPNTVDNADRAVDCSIALSLGTLADMISGELDPVNAFMSGKLRVEGDMAVAMKLQRVLG